MGEPIEPAGRPRHVAKSRDSGRSGRVRPMHARGRMRHARSTGQPLLKSLEPAAPCLQELRSRVHECRACDLWERATQAVFGEGAENAKVMLVGEQPGDAEDRAGRPFVGPAGSLLDEALEEAGIDRRLAYVTNVVKHFKWEPRGKRRLHSKPNGSEIRACRPWLEGEIRALRPSVLVCLGATAAQALLGAQFRVTAQRGVWIASNLAANVLATVHPSSILRERDDKRRHEEFERFVADLRLVAVRLAAAS
jgi:uracil-DNA glycosylase family protein